MCDCRCGGGRAQPERWREKQIDYCNLCFYKTQINWKKATAPHRLQSALQTSIGINKWLQLIMTTTTPTTSKQKIGIYFVRLIEIEKWKVILIFPGPAISLTLHANETASASARAYTTQTRNKVLQSDAQTIYCEAMCRCLEMVLNSHKVWAQRWSLESNAAERITNEIQWRSINAPFAFEILFALFVRRAQWLFNFGENYLNFEPRLPVFTETFKHFWLLSTFNCRNMV